MKRPPREPDPPQVVLDDGDERVGAEPAPQPLGQRLIEFDRDDPRPQTRERRCERSISGTKIEHQVTRAESARPDELSNQPAISQEVRADRVGRR